MRSVDWRNRRQRPVRGVVVCHVGLAQFPKVAEPSLHVSFTVFQLFSFLFPGIGPKVSAMTLLSQAFMICLHHSQLYVWSPISSYSSWTCDLLRTLGSGEGCSMVSKDIYTSQVPGNRKKASKRQVPHSWAELSLSRSRSQR